MIDEVELSRLLRMPLSELECELAGRTDIPPNSRAALLQGAAVKDAMRRPQVANAVKLLIGFRQGYIAGYKALLASLETDDLNTSVIDGIMQSVWSTASRQFSEHELMKNLLQDVLPTLAEIVDQHAEVDAAELQRIREQVQEDRKNDAIPFPYALTESGEAKLPRDRSLTYLGHIKAVEAMTRRIVKEVRTKRPDLQILLLCTNQNQAEQLADGYGVPFVALQHWKGICDKRKLTRGKLLQLLLLLELKQGVDLIICTDLSAAYTAGYAGRSDAANAGDAHRALWEFCKEQGSGLIGFLPNYLENYLTYRPNLADNFLEQLKLFSRVETLHYTNGDADGGVVCSPHNWVLKED